MVAFTMLTTSEGEQMRHFLVIRKSKSTIAVRWIDTPELLDQTLQIDEDFVDVPQVVVGSFYTCEVKPQNNFKLSSIQLSDKSTHIEGYQAAINILKKTYKSKDPLKACRKEADAFGAAHWDKGEFYRDERRVRKWLLEKKLMDYQYQQEKESRRKK